MKLSPGLRGIPVLGFLPFLKPELHRHFERLSRIRGPILSLRLGSKLYAVPSSPTAAREVLKNQALAFASHDVPATIRFVLGDPPTELLWLPYGPRWRSLRRLIVSQVLSRATIEASARIRRREVAAVREKSGSAVDVREVIFQMVLDAITSTLWGERVSGDGGNGMGFPQAIEAVNDLLLAPNVSD